MERILIAGCGDVAQRVIPLLARRYRVYALVRNAAYCEKLRRMGAVPVLGDLDDRSSLSCVSGLADAVLYLAPPPLEGVTDTRLRNLLAALSQGTTPARFVYISTSGVYGDCHGAWVSESTPIKAQSQRALRRVDAEHQARHWARRNKVVLSILRVPGIYARDRLPLTRLQQPCIVDAEDGYTNHIHANDLASICLAALLRGKSCRIYHASDDSQMKMGKYFDAVADAFEQPRAPRLSRAEVQRLVSPAMYSFMNESRRLTNLRMKRELGVRLIYPTVADFLKSCR